MQLSFMRERAILIKTEITEEKIIRIIEKKIHSAVGINIGAAAAHKRKDIDFGGNYEDSCC